MFFFSLAINIFGRKYNLVHTIRDEYTNIKFMYHSFCTTLFGYIRYTITVLGAMVVEK